ncbi:hypothetical protein TPDSL_15580 [Terrisporobacter petrolearius]
MVGEKYMIYEVDYNSANVTRLTKDGKVDIYGFDLK